MAMKVAVEQNVPAVYRFAHHNFCCIILRTQLLTWCDPLSVQVKTTQTTAIVAYNHPVRVKHRDNFKNKVIAKVTGTLVFTYQILKSSFHHETCIWLPRVNSWWQNNCSTDGYLLRSTRKVCYYYHFAIVASYSFCKNCLSYLILSFICT